MRYLFKTNRAFFLPYFAFLLIVTPLLFIFSKDSIHLYINSLNTSGCDLFFKYITYLGDGLMPVILSVLFLVISLRKSIIILSSGLLAGILAQFFKRVVFPDIVRPIKYFEGLHALHLVEGIQVHTSFSFPSGHSATIFSICIALAFYIKNNAVKLLFLLIAVIVAFSRVYLSQHFLNDIVAGSIVGCLATILMYIMLNKYINKRFDKPFNKLNVHNQYE